MSNNNESTNMNNTYTANDRFIDLTFCRREGLLFVAGFAAHVSMSHVSHYELAALAFHATKMGS